VACPGLSQPVKKNANWSGRQVYPAFGGLCEFGLASVALARGQSNQGSHPVAKIGATGFELEARASQSDGYNE
jgi:hypothetical protein